MYAEELCFAPKYVRLKQLLESGALGRPTLVKQSEKHDGPHAAHFWDVERSGGGVTMDMGCHAIEFFRWMLGRPRIESVYAQMSTQRPRRADARRRQRDPDPRVRRRGYGHRRGELDQARAAWTTAPRSTARRASPMPTSCTATPSRPTARAATTTPSRRRARRKGWSFTIYEEAWNYGFHGEMAHFVDCVQNDRTPLVTGDDGRAVLEAIFAAYESARTGRKVMLPFASKARKPIDLWWAPAAP